MKIKKQINIEIGERVKYARETAKLTQEQFAEQIGVSTQYISDLERGVVGVSIETLKKICIVLRVSSDQILFNLPSSGNLNALTEKCKVLSEEQLSFLLDMIDNLVAVVLLEREKQNKEWIEDEIHS